MGFSSTSTCPRELRPLDPFSLRCCGRTDLSASIVGDEASVETRGETAVVRHEGLRILRGLEGEAREDLLAGWIELWRGAVASHRAFIDVAVEAQGEGLRWTLTPA